MKMNQNAKEKLQKSKIQIFSEGKPFIYSYIFLCFSQEEVYRVCYDQYMQSSSSTTLPLGPAGRLTLVHWYLV